MNKLILLLGGNLGDVESNFTTAIKAIDENIGNIHKKSSLYKSEPWGFQAQERFLNQVLILDTPLNAFEVLKITQSIESLIGRKSKTKDLNYSSRLIDIDLLFFNQDLIETDELCIPHPRLHLRNFTLAPLVEISPEWQHPKLNKNVQWLFEHSEDESICTKI